MQLAKLNGIKAFILKHFEKLIFLNCLVAGLVLYYHDILYSLDGGGHYVSAKDLLEVGFHGYNDHYFLGGIQNLFYPPLHDLLLSVFCKANDAFFSNAISDRFLYSLFVWLTFCFYIYSLYLVSKYFRSVCSKLYIVLFSSWTLYLNIYSYEKYWTANLNFYNTPHVTFFQGLTFHDIYITGLTTQFLSAGFLILSILSLTKRNLRKTSILISLAILSHFIFGLVAVVFCTVKKLFESQFKDLFIIGITCLGLTAFFLIPMGMNHNYMVSQISMPLRSGFWLSVVALLFLFFKRGTLSFYLSFTAFALVGSIGLAKLMQKYELPIFAFHYYRLLFPSLLILILAVAFALNESNSKLRKGLLVLLFTIAWFGNFGGRFYTERLFEKYEPRIASVTPKTSQDLESGRTYFFGLSRPIDFAIEINTRLQGQRSFFTKGLYWESAPSNIFISEMLYQLMGPPTVLGFKHENIFSDKSCEVVSCFFKTFLNATGATEVWMPPQLTLLNYFDIGFKERHKFLSCYDFVLTTLDKSSGFLDMGAASENRYTNSSSSIVKKYSGNSPTSIADIVSRCQRNPDDDGRVDGRASPIIKRQAAGDYSVVLPQNLAKYSVSLQYFPGLTYESNGKNGLVPTAETMGITIEGSGPTKIIYKRPWFMWISYLLSIGTILVLIIQWVRTKCRIHSDK